MMTIIKVLIPLILTLLLGACSSDSDNAFFSDQPMVAESCVQADSDIQRRMSSANIEFVRTPDSCFSELVDFDYPPQYVEIDGLRMHYIEAGPADGELILMLHGQPSWSYLYRKMIPVLVSAGYRVIAADHIGMGRSDKPVDPAIHQYEQQVTWMKAFVAALELNDINLFVQDWGSLIGLRVAGDDPERFVRIILANGNLPVIPAGLNPFNVPNFTTDETLAISAEQFFSTRSTDRIDGFQEWINYAAGNPNLIAAEVIEFATLGSLSEAEAASYNAPFPSLIYKAAIRAFPSMVAGIEQQNVPALVTLGEFERPFLSLAGVLDRNLGSLEVQEEWIARVPGAMGQAHRRYMPHTLYRTMWAPRWLLMLQHSLTQAIRFRQACLLAASSITYVIARFY